MPVSEQTYLQVVREDPEGQWELDCGELRSKPAMTVEHGNVMIRVFRQLDRQLDEREYWVRPNIGRAVRSHGRCFVPDVLVVPAEQVRRLFPEPGMVELYPEPLPLVVEVWSPSTGEFDVTTKLDTYRQRGDLEVWFIHPYQRTLVAWRRRPDGAYDELTFTGGMVQPTFLPNVAIDLDALFD